MINASLNSNGEIVGLVTNKGNYTFQQPTRSPVTPSTYNGTPSIIGHLVIVSGNNIGLVIHWCVALVIGIYALIVGGLLASYNKLSRLLGKL